MVTPRGRPMPGGCSVGWGVEALASPGVGTRQAGVPAPRYITRRLGVAGIPGSRTVEGYPARHAPPAYRQLRTFPLKRQAEHTISISAPQRTAASRWTQAP